MGRTRRSHADATPPARVTIRASNRDNAELNLLTAPVLFLIAGLIVWYFELPLSVPVDARHFNPVIVVPIFFVVGGLCFGARGVLDAFRVRKFEDSTLELGAPHPGGTLHGTIRTTRDLTPTADYTLTIKCIETIAYGSGQPPRTVYRDELRWSDRATVPAVSVRSSAGIPVAFAIPGDAPPTRGNSDLGSGSGVRWVLEIQAPLGGLDYYAVFRLVVRPRTSG
jgi:hypothetical protein